MARLVRRATNGMRSNENRHELQYYRRLEASMPTNCSPSSCEQAQYELVVTLIVGERQETGAICIVALTCTSSTGSLFVSRSGVKS